MQITAEQLLREAKERQLEVVPPVSKINFVLICTFCIEYCLVVQIHDRPQLK